MPQASRAPSPVPDRPTLLNPGRVDWEGFANEIHRLGQEMRADVGAADFQHLLRVERMGRLCTLFGYLTAWLAPNPLSAFLIAQGRNARLLIGHHIGHRAYDRIPGIPARYTTKVFARGWRRFVDWFEWWDNDAWLYLHNSLHHPNTGDSTDADLVDPNNFRGYSLPVRYAIMAFFMMTWKGFYYAPYMQRELLNLRAGLTRRGPYRFKPADFYDLRDPMVRSLWVRNFLPFVLFHFVLVPLLFLPLGVWAVFSVAANAVLGEIIANVQGFITIRSSHSADDIPMFITPPVNRTDYYLRQVLGTVNYEGGSDFTDMMYTWTNYQVEHHFWVDLPMGRYQQARARVKEICARYGVPYAQENIWRRLWKTTDLYVGRTDQQHVDSRDLLGRVAA
ncbi:MAG: fatty acid desaturase [Myxococcaceae bacterium]